MVTVQPVVVLLACWATSRSRQPVGATCWVRQVVRLGGFVATTGDFKQHASRDERCIGLGGGMFGDAGRHTRTTVGASTLPMGIAVEVEGTFLDCLMCRR